MPETFEIVSFLPYERGRVVRVVQMTNDDLDEVGEDGGEGLNGGIFSLIPYSSRQFVPKVEGDSDDVEIYVGGAFGDRFDEREERGDVLDHEGFVPFSRFDEDSTIASHLLRVLQRRREGEYGLEGDEPGNDLFDESHVIV